MLLTSTLLALLCTTASAVVLPRAGDVHLAVSPQCGNLSGGIPADVNVGLGSLSSYKTIIAFGDSYTGGGATNGPTWVENLASSVGAKLINYGSPLQVADAGTPIDENLANDFMTTQELDPATTLYIVFFGIGDYAEAVATGETDMSNIAGVLYGSPGYAAFGYTDPGICVDGNQTCSDPAHMFYWAPGNPSATTHSIMATYVEEVLTQCQSST
ncbi:hypothetical protein C8R43DRAFT_1122086 [Mycena crocata]|nr:hypothetical protein C8R43DRAFT_1122086 [Mycena crocata]